MSQPKYGQIINCGITILFVSLFSLRRLRITVELWSGAVDKMKWPVFLQNASGNPILSLSANTMRELTTKINQKLESVDNWLKYNKLPLNYRKTQYTLFTKQKNI